MAPMGVAAVRCLRGEWSGSETPPAGRFGAGGPTFRAALGTIAKWTQ